MPNFMQLTPTLLVGVGGIGCWIADQVYGMAMEAGIPWSKRIRILGFDTDRGDLAKLRHLGDDQLVQTSTAETVFTLLTRYGNQIADWFVDDDALVTEIRQMSLLPGAGQIRMLSRLAFAGALTDGLKLAQIDNAVLGIATQDNRSDFQGHVNVLLVGSVAGGTGSGMFLQAALLLGARIRARGMTPEVRGLFLLPDIPVLAARLPVQQVPATRANGYAALRELHAIRMTTSGQTDRPVRFEYQMGEGLKPDAVPFASVVLMDFETQTGSNLGRGIDGYKELAAKAAYTLLFTPLGSTFQSGIVNEVRQRLEAAATGGDNSFAGVGLASIVYPETAMLDYLALSYGVTMLEGHWLRLDTTFRAELDRYHVRVANGETNLERPRRGDSYVRNLEQLALQERVRFFREIHAAVHPKVEDAQGNETVRIRFRDALDSLEQHLLAAFWDSSAKLRAARARQELAADALTDKNALGEDVRLYESQLRGDFAEIERALQDVVHDLFHNSVIAAMFLGEKEWKDWHLETYLLRGGPHLVQVRYFLYKLQELIHERLQGLKDKTQRTSIESTLRDAFDDPATKGIETALDIAIRRAESATPEFLDKRFGELRKFVRQYRDYYNSLLTMLRRFAEDGTRRRLYELLDQYVTRLLAVLERFFDELDDLRYTLTVERNQEESRHSLTAGLADGCRYVFAAPEAKQRLWSELHTRLEAATEGPAKVNAALTQALMERFRVENQAGAWETPPPFSGSVLFRQTMVEGFCRETIVGQYANLYRLPALEALRREALLNNQDPEALTAEVVALVASQSAPLISLADPAAGQDYRFWTMAPANRALIADEGRFQALFANADGHRPLVEEEFPPHTLSCLSLRVNLQLRDLRKLNPGLRAETNIAAPQRGVYYAAYRNLVDAILAHERDHPGRPCPQFTPHLDQGWHRPGILPELDPALEAVQNLHRAYVCGVALALLPWEERGGRPVTLFHDHRHRGTPQYEREILGRQDDLALLEVLEGRPGLLTSVLDRTRELMDDDAPPADADPLYEGLTNPRTLVRICRLLEDRTRAAVADPAAAAALGALFQVLREVHDLRHRHLGKAARRDGFSRSAEALIGSTERLLESRLPAETRRQALTMARGQFERVREA